MKSCGIADHDVEITLAQALTKLKSAKPKADKVVIQEPEQGASTYTNNFFTTTITGGSGQGLQAQEQEELTDEEKARLFVKFLEQRRNILQLREQKKRGTDHKQELKKGVSCTEKKEGSKKAEAEVIEGSSKRTGEELEFDKLKKQKLDEKVEAKVDDANKWKNQQGLVKVLNWKLFYSCGVHCVTVQSIPYYLLVEKMYPLTKHTLHQMFNNVKHQVDYDSEMAYELLRLVKKQLKEGYVPE
ncbi:hypothetical protein Tco_1015146 [Tanacetum coccineum]|uniref:Uncharacterized protein n=1 Tax=Tanacetum coccineum TaxID=301880 RepID=A0ABQ5FJX1_9ASTR